MRVERLGLGHKGLLYERLRKIQTAVSEYSFPNLFLFREVHGYEVLLDGDVFIRGLSYDGFRYIMPTSDIRDMDVGRLRAMMEGYDFLYPVPEERLGLFDPEEFEVEFREGDTDYVYTVEKMRTFTGRRLHKKRNLLKQFLGSYRHEALPLSNERLKDAGSVLEGWLKASGQTAAETDYGPCLDALRHYEELALCGVMYYAEGEPAGFVVGEELNPETFVLHFAKADVKFKGIYQYVFNNFASLLPSPYRLINLEQDLDRETLRVAKTSYVPDLLVKKGRVRPRRRAGRPAD